MMKGCIMKTIFRTDRSEKLLHEAYEKTLNEWEVPYSTLYVDTRFGKTHVITAGPEEGEPLILLHGFAFSSTMWKDNIKDLSKTNRVFALDFIGDINKSKATRQIESKIDCANWFCDVLKELRIEKANVMGMSYGGFLALVFAILVPEKINRLITICPGASLQKQKKTFFMMNLMGGIFPSEKNINLLMDYMSAKGNTIDATIRSQFIVALQNCLPRVKVFASFLSDQELKKISHPTLLLIGEYDVQYNPRLAIERAKILISNLETHLIEQAGHGITLEQPLIVNQYVLNFLAQD